uniref:Uncharacterized protein n=1 Tax=Romanomermis culicivorax TaxID=13658 RepID=A0A915K747_ROMCU
MLGKIDWHVTRQSFEKERPHSCGCRGLCDMSMEVDHPMGATAGGQSSNGFSSAFWLMELCRKASYCKKEPNFPSERGV